MMKLSRIFAGLLMLAVPALVSAQPVTKWTLSVYNVGAATPIQAPTDLLAANVTCNQTPPSANASTVNPTRVVFDDPNTAGKVCIWTDPGTGPLTAMPFGQSSYEGTLTATNAAGTTGESARASFSRPGSLAAVPGGVRLIK